ncbi:MAG: HAMP domain-containing sensor histidine kinase [Pseudomonadota bacterium]
MLLRSLSRSLSVRLLLIFLASAALFVYGAFLALRWVYSTDQLRELVRNHLSLHVEYVQNDLGDPPAIDKALALTEKIPIDIRIAGPDVNWASDPEFPAVQSLSFGTSGSEILGADTEAWLQGVEGLQFASKDGHVFLRLDKGTYAVVIASPKIQTETKSRRLLPIISGFSLLLVLLTYLAVRKLFEPLGRIRAGAARIGRGGFAHRIQTGRNDELGDLATDINTMAGDVERMLDAKRQLLLGISHELRSPLSRMNLALELEEQTKGHKNMLLDVREMEEIISSLLEAERLHGRHAVLNRQNFSGREIMEELISKYFARDIDRIRLDGGDDAELYADKIRISLALKNLVSNALRHTPKDSGPVTLAFSVEDDDWCFTVRDSGPGIPANEQHMLGEPFYRGDRSRTRDTGGSGLGLYLAQMVATAHGGSLQLDETYTHGARFILRIPSA